MPEARRRTLKRRHAAAPQPLCTTFLQLLFDPAATITDFSSCLLPNRRAFGYHYLVVFIIIYIPYDFKGEFKNDSCFDAVINSPFPNHFTVNPISTSYFIYFFAVFLCIPPCARRKKHRNFLAFHVIFSISIPFFLHKTIDYCQFSIPVKNLSNCTCFFIFYTAYFYYEFYTNFSVSIVFHFLPSLWL